MVCSAIETTGAKQVGENKGDIVSVIFYEVMLPPFEMCNTQLVWFSGE